MTVLDLLLVDDRPDFLGSLRALLASVPTLSVVGEACDGVAAVAAAAELQPDVVLMDLHMPSMNGIEATSRIVTTSPHIAVLVLTMLEDDESVLAAMRAGARGYLLKGARRPEIVRAIESVAQGGMIFGPNVAERVLTLFNNGVRDEPVPDAFPQLTDRERHVLSLTQIRS